MLIIMLAIGLTVTFNVALKWAIEQVRWYKRTHYYDGEVNAPYRPDKRSPHTTKHTYTRSP